MNQEIGRIHKETSMEIEKRKLSKRQKNFPEPNHQQTGLPPNSVLAMRGKANKRINVEK